MGREGGLHGSLLLAGLRVARTQDHDPSPTLEGTLHLLHGDNAEDALQLAIQPVHPIDGGCR
jgi:hypothetical protein